MDILEQEIRSGVRPDRIAYCSFTKKAVEEAVERVIDRFGFAKADMVHFRTIHSTAYNALGLTKTQVMGHRDYKVVGDHLGLKFGTKHDMSDLTPFSSSHAGDRYMFIDGYSRAKRIDPKQLWDNMDHDGLNWFEFLRFKDVLEQYKQVKGMYDFPDMLEIAHKVIPVDVLIIDEAQDLSTAQWHFLEPTLKAAKRVYIGGDDDQAIFQWAGADVEKFLSLKGKTEVLSVSYRVPEEVHRLAKGIVSKIKHRAKKKYSPSPVKGEVVYWGMADHIDMSSGTWLMLSRNSYQLAELGEVARQKGYAYSIRGKSTISGNHVKAIKQWERWRKGADLPDSDIALIEEYLPKGCTAWPHTIWHEAFTRMPEEDKQYYISLLRRNESLTKNPRININTIHGVKGGEADHVIMLTDMARGTWDAAANNYDAEHRVWYVGATRCKESLNIIMPRGRFGYEI